MRRGVLKRKNQDDSAGQDDYPALLTGLDQLVDGLRQAGYTAWADQAEAVRATAPFELDNARVVLEHHETILGNARHDAARIRAAAEEALEDTLSKRTRLLSRDSLTAAANEAAEKLVAGARREGEQLVAAARGEADQIVAAARREADQIVAAAGSEPRPSE